MTDEGLNKPGVEIPPELQHQVAITTLDRIYNCRAAVPFGQ